MKENKEGPALPEQVTPGPALREPGYEYWDSGDPVPDNRPAGCEVWCDEGDFWMEDFGSWIHFPRRWPKVTPGYDDRHRGIELPPESSALMRAQDDLDFGDVLHNDPDLVMLLGRQLGKGPGYPRFDDPGEPDTHQHIRDVATPASDLQLAADSGSSCIQLAELALSRLIPEGWERITEGLVQAGDRVRSPEGLALLGGSPVGTPVEDQILVIRRKANNK